MLLDAAGGRNTLDFSADTEALDVQISASQTLQNSGSTLGVVDKIGNRGKSPGEVEALPI